jgi:hypothetical protein
LANIGATAAEQAMVLSTLRAYQRVWAITNDVDVTHTVVAAGFSSAMSIATLTRSAFTAQSTLDAATAQIVWNGARTNLSDVTKTTATILDLTGPSYAPLKVRNVPKSALQYLAQLPGYQDLFGHLSYCNCTECQSILGPAAYFVDLMKFIDDNLRSQFTQAGNPIDIAVRRPDLWTLPLTCDNIDERIPTLEIVDEVLENYIARRQNPTIPLDGLAARLAIMALVYDTTFYNPYTTSTPPVPASFQQPFCLPQARIASYLPVLGGSLAAIAEAVAATPRQRAQAELNLSAPELAIVSTPVTSLSQLSTIYSNGDAAPTAAQSGGIPFQGTPQSVSEVDAVALCQAMGLSRADLGAVVTTAFVKAGGANISITPTKLSADSVQNDIEWVTGLTADALDRMHRFTRMVRKTGWAIGDLDLVLSALGDTTLSLAGIEALATVHALQSRFSLSIGDLCALVGPIPQVPVGTSAFDALFNAPSYILYSALGGLLPQPQPGASTLPQHIILPGFLEDTGQAGVIPLSNADKIALVIALAQFLPRLLAGLGVDIGGLESLVRQLAPFLEQSIPPATPGFNPADPTQANRYFILSIDNLTLLYRHARLARMFGLSIDDFVQLLGIAGIDHVGSLSNLTTLVDVKEWWSQSVYSLDDVTLATGGAPRSPGNYIDPAKVAAQVVSDAATALNFTNTIFAVALGTTEQGSVDLLAALQQSTPPIVKRSATDGSWSIVPGVDLSAPITMTIPATATVTTPATATTWAVTTPVTQRDVLDALTPHVASESLKRSLVKAFGFPMDKLVSLAMVTGQSLTAAAVISVVRGDTPLSAPPNPDALTVLIAALLPMATVFASSVWNTPPLPAGTVPPASDPTIDFVFANPSAFGTTNLPQPPDVHHPNPWVSLAQLRALSVYGRLTQRQLSDSPPGNPVDLQYVLEKLSASFGNDPAMVKALSNVLAVPVGLVVSLGLITLPTTSTAAALDQLDHAAQLAKTLGVDGWMLGALTSGDFATLSAAADGLVVAVAARQPDPTSRATQLGQLEQPILEARRDALADYLFNSISPKLWSTLNDLYDYFLIDVASGGCSTTSRVVSATTTAQLYVNRAILRLEKNAEPPWDPSYIELTLDEEATAEWEWRKNYRVWQANREVFLWPETYLEPDLRDDKTPLFEDLENQLLQTDINDQNVLDAYTAYLAGFEELAKLKIAGVFVETSIPGQKASNGSTLDNVLHLFGVTATDPPVYYYRTCENLFGPNLDGTQAPIWRPWRKISVQINGRKVSPVVVNGRLQVFWTTITTRSQNQVSNGSSQFSGYLHTMKLYVTSLRPDQTWSAPQQIELSTDYPWFAPAAGQIRDPVIGSYGYDATNHTISVMTQYPSQYAYFPYIADADSSGQPLPMDDYTISGANWDWVWPGQIQASGPELVMRNFVVDLNVDIFGRTTSAGTLDGTGTVLGNSPPLLSAEVWDGSSTSRALYASTPLVTNWPSCLSALANAIVDRGALRGIGFDSPDVYQIIQMYEGSRIQIGGIPPKTELLAVPGAESNVILQIGNDMLLVYMSDDGTYYSRRLGTTVADDAARVLFQQGVQGLLDPFTQANVLNEYGPGIDPGLSSPGAGINMRYMDQGYLDFDGPMGVYYKEIFAYIPHLIANALNSQGQYESAERWYQYIFDPTATDKFEVVVSGSQASILDPILSRWEQVPATDVAHRLLDRVWRYVPLRGIDAPTLRAILTDATTIQLYMADPFSPWAIARARPSAFQKAMVMKYVSNLLDWADSLFTQFTMESVSEALMLYVMASELLGPRPVPLGQCGAGLPTALDTYAVIEPQMSGKGDFLLELETWIYGARVAAAPQPTAPVYGVPRAGLVSAVTRNPLASPTTVGLPVTTTGVTVGATAAGLTAASLGAAASNAGSLSGSRPVVTTSPGSSGLFRGLGWNETRTISWGPALGNSATTAATGGRTTGGFARASFAGGAGGFGWHVVREIVIPIFCVPTNPDLLALWDRVEDRLYKIRHCENIDGVVEQLALFAPPINPLQLMP